MKKRVMLTVAYDGTNYCGWQVQPNGDTVQAQLNRHLSDLLKEDIHVMGASRTDAGVHARGNVCAFDTENRMPAERISFALNTRLPEDIKVRGSRQVPEDFHPRFTSTVKTYRYQILNTQFPDPTRRRYAFFYHYPLDAEKMHQAAGYLVGEHDFSSFCTAKPEDKSHVRTIYGLDVTRDAEDMITIEVTGNGFLYNMVRIIAGTLIKVGSGALAPEEMPRILEAKDRSRAGDTARPEGLTLLKIRYPEWEKEFSC